MLPNWAWIVLSGAGLLLTTSASARPASAKGPETYRPDRILIQPKSTSAQPALEALHQANGSRCARRLSHLIQAEVLLVPDGKDPRDLVETYRRSGLVDQAEVDYLVEPTATPADPYYGGGFLWYLNQAAADGSRVGPDIQAALAWDTKSSAENVVLAVIDSGANLSHEDLAGNLWTNPDEIPGNGKDDDGNGIIDDIHGLDAANDTGEPLDASGHGSRVAGVIGAVGDNGRGTVGVAWRTRMMICRYLADNGQGSISDVLQCFDYARSKGAKIINASFGSTNFSSLFQSALTACRTAGIIVVAGSGNGGLNNDQTPFYPASYALDNVVAVAATTRSDELASYSSYGAKSVDLAAPGSDILSTGNGSEGSYIWDSGTSYSTAIASGALALLWARFPNESYSNIIQRLLSSVDPLPQLQGKCVTGGRLNLAKALGPAYVVDFSHQIVSNTSGLGVAFTDRSYGNSSAREWDFGDGTTASEPSPVHRFPFYGSYPVSLSLFGSSGQRFQTVQWIRLEPSYTLSATSYAWQAPAGATKLTLARNAVSSAITLPFPFLFQNQVRTQAYISANGLMGFSPDGLSSPTSVDIPNPAAPNDFLAPYWTDLIPGTTSSINHGVNGTSPNRRFVVTWDKLTLPPPQSAVVSFQVVLEETSGAVTFQYAEVAPSSRNAGAAGKTATVGFEGADGLTGARFSFKGSTLLTNQQAIRLTRPTDWPSEGALALVSGDELIAAGPLGGPFEPPSQAFVLTNRGGSSVAWAAQYSDSDSWVKLSTPRAVGALLPGGSLILEPTLTADALQLPAGNHRAILLVSNLPTPLVYQLQIYRPIQLSAPVLTSLGSFSFSLQGDPAAWFVLEGSSNLLLWTPLATNRSDAQGLLPPYQLPISGAAGQFFRALRLPP